MNPIDFSHTALKGQAFPWAIERLPEIDSTSSELMRRAKSGRLESTVLLACHQTAGRGRMGRTWVSEPEQALTFSLGFLYRPKDWMGLSLVVGLSLLKAIDPLGSLELSLKWPNDLWHKGARGPAKLAGILIETVNPAAVPTAESVRYCVVGIGLNRFTPSSLSFEGQFPPPIGLKELGSTPDEESLLQAIVSELTRALTVFELEGFKPFQESFDQFDLLKDQEVTVGSLKHAIALGVNECGALQVRTPQGVQSIVSQEVSVRPKPFNTSAD